MRTSTSLLGTGLALLTATLFASVGITGAFAQSSKTNSSSAKVMAPVDVNSADLKTLETLPGVGPATAQKIIDGRPYQSLADLQKVKGLSKSKVTALKDVVTFGSTTPAPASTDTTATTTKKSRKKSTASTTSSTTNTSSSSASSSTPAASSTSTRSTSSSTGSSTPSAGTLAPGEKLNINTATAADLDKIPGIGPTKAQAIVDYRTQNGNFNSIEDIQKVKGIKSATFSKIKDYIKVSN